MPKGEWEKCGATLPKANNKQWICGKKKGHDESGSPDKRSHVDTKNVPIHRWKVESNESR